MLMENMKMAFAAIKANKLRSLLTMLGIIIGIGSVISIVSIGDTMRGLFADLYKDVGITQAYVSIGYWVEDVRQSDYFTLDEMERAREAFSDEIAYIDSSGYASSDAEYRRTKVKFEYQGIDFNYQDVQPVDLVYGRYLNEGDILGRRKNAVMDTDSAMMLFGTERAVGKSFRTTIYGSVEEMTVVGVYRKKENPLQALMMGGSKDTGTALIPYTLLTWPNDFFYQLHVYAKPDVDLEQFFDQFKAYAAKMHGREAEDMYMYTAMQEMTSVDTMMGGLSMAVGGIAAISLLVGGIGIMNIMLVSVTERTREIGIRKALGAKTSSIMMQFLAESAILTVIGGIIGIVLGIAGGYGICSVMSSVQGMTITPGINAATIIAATLFSCAVGIFFGIYPAKKAAALSPIEALRRN